MGIISATTAWAISTAVTVAATYVLRQDIRNDIPTPKNRKQMVRSSVAPRNIVYGKARTSGPIVFAQSSGENNQYLHLVIPIAGHQIEEFSQFWINDEAVELSNGNVISETWSKGYKGSHFTTKLLVNNSSIVTNDKKNIILFNLNGISSNEIGLTSSNFYSNDFISSTFFFQTGTEEIIKEINLSWEKTITNIFEGETYTSKGVITGINNDLRELGDFYLSNSLNILRGQYAVITHIDSVPIQENMFINDFSIKVDTHFAGALGIGAIIKNITYKYYNIQNNLITETLSISNIFSYNVKGDVKIKSISTNGNLSTITFDTEYGAIRELLKGDGVNTGAFFNFRIPDARLLAINTYGINYIHIDITYFDKNHISESLIKLYPHKGNDISADYYLRIRCPDKWTSDHKLQGIAYIYAQLEYAQEKFYGGIPNIGATVKGKLCVDDYGGKIWSDNWATIIRDYLLADYGLRCSNSEIDISSYWDSKNYTITTLGEYKINGVFYLDEKPIDIIKKFLAAGNGTLLYYQGKYHILCGRYTIPNITIDGSFIRDKIKIQTCTPLSELNNGIRARYVSPKYNYQEAEICPILINDFLEYDNNKQSFAETTFDMVTDEKMARYLACVQLKRSRHGMLINLPCNFKAFNIVTNDVVNVNIPNLFPTNKEFRVIKWQLNEQGIGIDLTLKEEVAEDWNFDATIVNNTTTLNYAKVINPAISIIPKRKANSSLVSDISGNIHFTATLDRTKNLDAQTLGTTFKFIGSIVLSPGDYQVKALLGGLTKKSKSFLELRRHSNDTVLYSLTKNGVLGWIEKSSIPLSINSKTRVNLYLASNKDSEYAYCNSISFDDFLL